MNNEVRGGILYVQRVSGLGKKFQKRWVALFKRSSHGVSRLEVYDSKENFDKRVKGSKKHLISLDSCATITRNSLGDGKKNEYQIHLTFEDNKEMLFQAESDEDMELWYAAMSSVIFGGAGLTDNVIYQEYEEDGYDVVIKQNEVANKLQLSGMYRLVVSADDVELRDKNTKQVITHWPLQLLRKYGRDKQEFSLEAGRRCPTGPGMFYFITDHYNNIFKEVDDKVRALANRSRSQSTSTVKPPSVSPTFSTSESPSPFAAAPPSPFNNQVESEYDNPLDMRASAQVKEESIYNEPVNTKPSFKTKGPKKNGKVEKPAAAPKGKSAKPTTAPPKPERAHPQPAKKFGAFGKKDKKNKNQNLPPTPIPPSQVEEATYSEALTISGAVEEAEPYGRLDFEGTKRFSNTSNENQYGSLNWKGDEAEESEYATAGSINQGYTGAAEAEESLYDQVQRK